MKAGFLTFRLTSRCFGADEDLLRRDEEMDVVKLVKFGCINGYCLFDKQFSHVIIIATKWFPDNCVTSKWLN